MTLILTTLTAVPVNGRQPVKSVKTITVRQTQSLNYWLLSHLHLQSEITYVRNSLTVTFNFDVEFVLAASLGTSELSVFLPSEFLNLPTTPVLHFLLLCLRFLLGLLWHIL